MKKAQDKFFSLIQKKQIAEHMQIFMETTFSSPIKNMRELLDSQMSFANNQSLPELILKQTIIKGSFSKATWPKREILEVAELNPAIVTDTPKEKADVRFFSEIITANAFLEKNNNPSNLVRLITFNSEKPQQGSLLVSRGNQYKDATVDVSFSQNNNLNFLMDIKIGNNGTKDIFIGALCPYPLNKDNSPCAILNSRDTIGLDFIQEQRVRHLNAVALTILDKNADFYALKTFIEKMQHHTKMGFDPITINNLIQTEILKSMSLNLLHKQPSLFAITLHGNNLQKFNEKFLTKLQPYIEPTIFDNRDNYIRFMRISLKIYNETVAEIAKNIENSFWKGTGFENIADDLFK